MFSTTSECKITVFFIQSLTIPARLYFHQSDGYHGFHEEPNSSSWRKCQELRRPPRASWNGDLKERERLLCHWCQPLQSILLTWKGVSGTFPGLYLVKAGWSSYIKSSSWCSVKQSSENRAAKQNSRACMLWGFGDCSNDPGTPNSKKVQVS